MSNTVGYRAIHHWDGGRGIGHKGKAHLVRDDEDRTFLCGTGWLGLESKWPAYPFDAADPDCCRTCARMSAPPEDQTR